MAAAYIVPEVILAGGNEALDFVLRNRTRLFPQAPVVHMGVDRSFRQSIPNLPTDVIGVAVEYDASGTIDQALRRHPDLADLQSLRRPRIVMLFSTWPVCQC
jgi:hypothetical protein